MLLLRKPIPPGDGQAHTLRPVCPGRRARPVLKYFQVRMPYSLMVPDVPCCGGLNMKLLLLLALLLTLNACQAPGRFQSPQNGPLANNGNVMPLG